MRTVMLLCLAGIGAMGCSNRSFNTADAQADGGPFCPAPLDCSRLPGGAPQHACTLSEGIASACMPCMGSGDCGATTGIVDGATYTYITVFYIDTGSIWVYDKAGALVAVLGISPTVRACYAGPADFDPTEALATSLSDASKQALRQLCAAAADGGADAQSGRD